jgi:hypothetical protein
MAKPGSNFVYCVTKTGGWNKLCKYVRVRHVTYERVQYLCKITQVQEEESSIVNEYVLFYN